MPRPTTIERAYELARSGECATITDIKKRLDKEGYPDAGGQLYGRTLQTELRRLCAEAKVAEEGASSETDGGSPNRLANGRFRPGGQG